MTAQTIEQFKILQYINSVFAKGALTLKPLDRASIQATDSEGDKLIFYYDRGIVKFKEAAEPSAARNILE